MHEWFIFVYCTRVNIGIILFCAMSLFGIRFKRTKRMSAIMCLLVSFLLFLINLEPIWYYKVFLLTACTKDH